MLFVWLFSSIIFRNLVRRLQTSLRCWRKVLLIIIEFQNFWSIQTIIIDIFNFDWYQNFLLLWIIISIYLFLNLIQAFFAIFTKNTFLEKITFCYLLWKFLICFLYEYWNFSTACVVFFSCILLWLAISNKHSDYKNRINN